MGRSTAHGLLKPVRIEGEPDLENRWHLVAAGEQIHRIPAQ